MHNRHARIRRGMKMLRPFFFLLSLTLAVAVVLGTTLAWMTAEDSVGNRLNSQQRYFEITVNDVFTKPDTPVNPGDPPVPKRVGAVNTGEKPGFVRLLVFPTVIAEDGKTILPAEIGEEILLNVDENAATRTWRRGPDGYYYYLDLLAPGAESADLFTTVQLADNLGEEYKKATLNIDVMCEAVDTTKWNYREAWWNTANAPTDATMQAIDAILAAKAR